ncbi:MAG TPA: hypothetical protein VFV94_02325, partial [Polyangiaceae bacterium]|nr:hypothetical protein [Polyangiaceae bacterium]
MSNSSIDFAKVRELVTLPPPRGMKARVLETVLAEKSRPSLRVPRTLSLVFVLLLVSATAAAVVGSSLAPWSRPLRWLQLFRPTAPPPAAPTAHSVLEP